MSFFRRKTLEEKVVTTPIAQAKREGHTKLDLTSMKLTGVPDSLGKLTQLSRLSLDLNYNQLTIVPDWLAKMPELWSLRIYGNPITQPPPEQLGKALTDIDSRIDLDALRHYFFQLR